ncbi:aminotransferase class V-fold PLP-dependent enzyme [Niastella sp. MAH-29]|uniref:Aminotransferase class V-fold PLP-dependent enzyme n=2 Tax=Chitinophagaceae TaxID=563835 RepID=A0ABS3YX59_9BACT|nr:aminotransferase class V-fold PLP-dependent enzyme [Niastella soli]
MLKTVKEAGLQALETRATPWKISSEDWFTNAEKLRTLASKVFQTNNNNIALIPSASYGLAVAAKNFKLKAGKEIIVLAQQYPSNYYVWENLASQQHLKIVIVQKERGKTLTESVLGKINSSTGIIALPNCHWINGTYIDLQKISDASRSSGSYLVLDLSQSLGALQIDMDKIQPDFAVSVGYKWLMGPYGLGYMYVSKKWQDIGEPLEYSWLTKKGSENFADLTTYVTGYRDGARKFDMGEFPQFNLLPMSIAALQQIDNWDIGFIQTELKKLTDKIIYFKKDLGVFDETELGVGHISSIPLNDLNLNKLKDRLQTNKVVISFRGTSIRVSPHLYNDIEDIDKLLSCLQD